MARDRLSHRGWKIPPLAHYPANFGVIDLDDFLDGLLGGRAVLSYRSILGVFRLQ